MFDAGPVLVIARAGAELALVAACASGLAVAPNVGRLELALLETAPLEAEAKPATGGALFKAGITFDFQDVAVSLVLADAGFSVIDGLPRQFEPASGVKALVVVYGTLAPSAGSPLIPLPRGMPSFVSDAARS